MPLNAAHGYDGRLLWFDADKRAPIRAIDAHKKWIRRVAASPDGKTFVRQSGAGWIAADIASGAEKAVADRRGQTTISFYLGEPPSGAAHPGSGL